MFRFVPASYGPILRVLSKGRTEERATLSVIGEGIEPPAVVVDAVPDELRLNLDSSLGTPAHQRAVRLSHHIIPRRNHVAVPVVFRNEEGK